MIASLPMYGTDPAAVELLWQALRSKLLARGLDSAPASLAWPHDLGTHWPDRQLLLSQACGYPLTHALDRQVQLLGAFRYAAPGCEGAGYRSFLVARDVDRERSLGDFRGRTFVANSLDSQSGFHSVRPLLAALGAPTHDAFFGRTLFSGSHMRSLESVRAGDADVAAIDCVTLALAQRAESGVMEGLCVVGATALTPGLPLITSIESSPRDVQTLRKALHELVEDPSLAAVRDALLIDGFEELQWSDYAVLRDADPSGR